MRIAVFLNSDAGVPTIGAWVQELGRAARSARPRGRRLRRLLIGRRVRGGQLQRRSRQGQEGRQGHVPGRGGRRLPRPGADVLHVRLRGGLRHAAAALLVQARRRREAGAGPRRGRAADLGGQQDDHGEDPLRGEVLAARQPRGHHQGHQVRVRARVHRQRALGLRDLLLRRHQGRAGRARASSSRSRASRRRTTTRSSSSSTGRPPSPSRPRW